MKKKENDEQLIMEKRKRNYSSKKVGEHLRKSITTQISKLKRAETVEIMKLREESINKIREHRENLIHNKKEQYLKVKGSEDIIRKNIQHFWERKKNFFANINKSMKNENEQVSLMKEKEIFELEKKEENLIQRLEKSQNIDEMTVKQLEEVIITPLEEFVEKYGEEKKEKQLSKKPKKFNGLSKMKSEKDNHSQSLHIFPDIKLTGSEKKIKLLMS